MRTRRVYRLENDNGDGPFHASGGPIKRLLLKYGCYDHPGPDQDGIYCIAKKGMRCGFRSLTQLHDWFPPEMLRSARELGFKVKVFDVPSANIAYGKHQLVFGSDKCTKLS